MAKKKDFSKVVEESFEEGYRSEPETVVSEPVQQEAPAVEPEVVESEPLSANELLLRRIIAGDEDELEALWAREDRSTYYLTDLHRACIDIMSHEEGIKKNEVIVSALNRFFPEEVKAAAKELVVSRAIKKLEKDIREEKSSK